MGVWLHNRLQLKWCKWFCWIINLFRYLCDVEVFELAMICDCCASSRICRHPHENILVSMIGKRMNFKPIEQQQQHSKIPRKLIREGRKTAKDIERWSVAFEGSWGAIKGGENIARYPDFNWLETQVCIVNMPRRDFAWQIKSPSGYCNTESINRAISRLHIT